MKYTTANGIWKPLFRVTADKSVEEKMQNIFQICLEDRT